MARKRKNPPTATGKKLTTNGGNLGSMMKLNEGKYKVTRFARDKNRIKILPKAQNKIL